MKNFLPEWIFITRATGEKGGSRGQKSDFERVADTTFSISLEVKI